MHHFLGMKIVQDDITRDVWIGQPVYNNLLCRKGSAKRVSTPVDTSAKLTKAAENEDKCDRNVYQSAFESLLYLSTGTRPDIAYAVGSVAKYTSNPTQRHWIAVKRILWYLKGTGDFSDYNI